METLATPKIEMLLFRLSVLSSDLTTKLDNLKRHIRQTDDETIILLPAEYNVVDRKKDKQRHLKSWKIELKDIVDTAIDYESLT